MCGLGYFAAGAEFTLLGLVGEEMRMEFSFSLNSWAGVASVTNGVAFFSGLAFGRFADKFGRKPAFILSQALVAVGGLGGAFASSWWEVIVWRCVTGVGLGGLQVVDFVFLSEMLPPSKKAAQGQLVFLYGCLGFVYLAVMDLLLRKLTGTSIAPIFLGLSRWRLVALIAVLPIIPALIVRLCFVLESPRFLISQRKWIQARNVLIDIQGVSSREKVPQTVEKVIPEDLELYCESKQNEPCNEKNVSLLSVITKPPFPLLSILWLIQGTVYSGAFIFYRPFLSQAGVSPDLIFPIMAICEIPGVLLAGWLSRERGRIRALVIFFFLATVSAFICWIGVISEFGFLVISGVCGLFTFHIPIWGLLFVLTPELYPAEIRASAMGLYALCKNAPSVASPFLGAALVGLGRPGIFIGSWLALLSVGAAQTFIARGDGFCKLFSWGLLKDQKKTWV